MAIDDDDNENDDGYGGAFIKTAFVFFNEPTVPRIALHKSNCLILVSARLVYDVKACYQFGI